MASSHSSENACLSSEEVTLLFFSWQRNHERTCGVLRRAHCEAGVRLRKAACEIKQCADRRMCREDRRRPQLVEGSRQSRIEKGSRHLHSVNACKALGKLHASGVQRQRACDPPDGKEVCEDEVAIHGKDNVLSGELSERI